MHIIKWNSQEEKRSGSWSRTIENSREEILDKQEKKPSLNDEFLKKNWDRTFDKAKKKAENEMGKKTDATGLTWKDVFISKYTLIAIFAFIFIKFFL